MILIGQVMDFDGNTSAIKIALAFDDEFENQDVILDVLEPKSVIVKNWALSGAGQLTSLES